jgi:hypothetical protein
VNAIGKAGVESETLEPWPLRTGAGNVEDDVQLRQMGQCLDEVMDALYRHEPRGGPEPHTIPS